MKSNYYSVDTPSLLIDREILIENIKSMQTIANQRNVKLRPHSKSHKMADIAKMQIDEGAIGIAVAKVGEAEVMAQCGIKDIFIANQIVGESKINRIKELSKSINVTLGIDNIYQVEEINKVFESEGLMAQVLIEIEIGEERSGIIEEDDFIELINFIASKPFVNLIGIFSHDGHSYHAKSLKELKEIFYVGQKRTLKFAEIAKSMHQSIQIVSVGSTPPFMFDFELLEGITEIRVGTYALMDVAQGNVIDTYDRCAASIITTVISKPNADRFITDAGSKALTSQTRHNGLCATKGYGMIKGTDKIHVDALFDEHGIVYSKVLMNQLNVGDKIEVFPNHICPVCNLYDYAYLVSNGEVIKEMKVTARGKLR